MGVEIWPFLCLKAKTFLITRWGYRRLTWMQNKSHISCNVLWRCYLMFHRTLNVPPHGGEEIQDNSMYTFAGRYINKDIQDNSMYSVWNHIKIHTHRRVGGGEAAANPSICIGFDVISNRIHAIILYFFIYVTTCECIHAIVVYFFAAMRRNI